MTIPNNVTTIGLSAFEKCSNLATVNMGSGISFIGKFAFEDCKSLKTLDLSNLNDISDGICRNCTSLKSVNFASSFYSVGNYAFKGCTNLSMTSSPNATFIGRYAFAGCNLNWNFSIADNVISIYDNAFRDCTNIEHLSFPADLDDIQFNAFANCTNIESISTGRKDPIQISASVFKNYDNLGYIDLFVPTSSYDAYKNADVWGEMGVLPCDEYDANKRNAINGENTETAIKTISDVEDDLSLGNVYNMQGHKVQKLIVGHIYIVNGKKFIAK